MRRIAVAGFQHETNTFSPIPTRYEDFAGKGSSLAGKLGPDELRQLGDGRYNSTVSGFYHQSAALGLEVVPLVSYSAKPSNMIPEDVFNRIMEDILSYAKQDTFDGVFLDLHGAMVFGKYQDGETEILRRLRAVVGDIPIVASLDLHGNISRESLQLCSAMVSCRHYPHTDMFETGERCAQIMVDFLDGRDVYWAYRQIPFLLTSSKENTLHEPSKSLYALIDEVEKDPAVISASIMQGFCGADIEHMGPSVFTYAISPVAAERGVRILYEKFLALEMEFTSNVPGVEDAVSQAIQYAAVSDKPVVLADIQDNSGGGSSSDTMWLAREMLKQGAEGTVVGMIYDPSVAELAHEAGIGSQIYTGLGGKLYPGDEPLEAEFVVEALHDGAIIGTGPMAKGMQFNIGKAALLRTRGVQFVVGSVRLQAADQALFTTMGVIPSDMKIVVVKSANHFRADFEPIASQVLCALAPGSDVEDPSTFTYKNLRSGVRLKGMGPVHQPPTLAK